MRRETVLIVDDEPGILELVAAALRNSGYLVLKAPDGEAALEIAAQHPGPIDLLLTDVRMPGLPGPEICLRLQQRRPGTRYLLMSGYPDGEVRGMAFLPKPFRVLDLLQSVRRVLDGAPGQPAEPARSDRVAASSSRRR